jgi:superfamily II DNA or RNA helicase
MIELTVRPARTSFSGPERQLKKMFRCLRVKDKNNWWRQRAALKRVGYFSDIKNDEKRDKKIEQLKESVQYIKFYERRGDTFASGLLDMVIKFLDKKGVKYSVKDNRQQLPVFKPIKRFQFEDSIENRAEQVEIVNKALRKGKGIIHASTNTGKTECACAIVSEFHRQLKRMPRVLFLIHRAGLAQQTADRFRKHLPNDVRIFMVGGGKKRIPQKPGIVVATVQTASNLLQESDFERFQEKCDILFIDETHVNRATQCSKIVNRNEAPMRFSLSGTIDRKNKKKMLSYVGMTGPIIAEVRNKELVDLGRSAKPVIRFVEVHTEEIPKKAKFAAAYSLGIVKNKKRNELVVREVLRYLNKDYKTLVTVARISHGLKLKKLLESNMDLPVEFLSGSTPLLIRKKVLKRFENGKLGVLLASPIFDTGMDISGGVDAWINSAAGLGWELILQRMGRVLRKNPRTGNVVYISDFIDTHNEYLMKHSMARLKHYINEKIAKISIIER